MNNTKKILLIVLTISSMFLYVPVNRLISGGYTLESTVDKYIPLIPVFVIPYLFGLVFWVSIIIYINLKKDNESAKRFNIMIISASIISVVIYLLIPTFVNRPEIHSTDIFSNILSLVYANDKVYNAAPSGHTFYTLLCFLNLSVLVPKRRLVWSVITVLVIVSTVLTKQHNFLDVIVGVLFALGIYFFVNRYSDINKSNRV